MTSPPFALTRKKEYGNQPIERDIGWLMPFCLEIKRVLKPTGSFVLDIGGSWVPVTPSAASTTSHWRSNSLRNSTWLKSSTGITLPACRVPPSGSTVRRIRVKDAVNMVWWFGKTEYPKADNRKVLQPYSERMKSLLKQGYQP